MFGTTASGTYSLAPEETLLTVWFSCADRREGMTTSSTPNWSAERRMAPRFWGSVMPSRTSTRLFSPSSSAR